MLSHFSKCEKKKEIKSARVVEKNKGKLMLLSNCVVSDIKNSWVIKKGS